MAPEDDRPRKSSLPIIAGVLGCLGFLLLGVPLLIIVGLTLAGNSLNRTFGEVALELEQEGAPAE